MADLNTAVVNLIHQLMHRLLYILNFLFCNYNNTIIVYLK